MSINDTLASIRRSSTPDIALASPPEWTREAACDGFYDEESDRLLHPDGPPSNLRMRKIKERFCGGCPVVAECLQLGIDTGSRGIWGGKWLKGNTATAAEKLHKEVIDRVKRGETDDSIARMTGLHATTVAEWRRAEGLERNLPYGHGLTATIEGRTA